MIAGPRTPVLVGVGVVNQRERDPRKAREPIELMIEATRRAGRDSGAPALLRAAEFIAVPKGRWHYGDPARLIAAEVGADRARTALSLVGVLQQSLIADACRLITTGEVDVALIVGGDAGYRLARAQRNGVALTDRVDDRQPDVLLRPRAELRHPAELRAGLQMPVGVYALIDSAFRASLGWSLEDHLSRTAERYSRFSEIAAGNPYAWRRHRLRPDEIRARSPRDPMQAFPYSRVHCSSWSVDQAGALLLCSAERAAAAGTPAERWVFPLASAESNHMLVASARATLAELPGARLSARAALEHAELPPDRIDLVDLYSPFPIAVELYAREAGLDLSRDLTVTGAMPFAGGPYNNYVLQATARVAVLLRAGVGQTALVSAASGVLTKQAFAVWSSQPGQRPFLSADVTGEVARATATREVLVEYTGVGVVIAHTLLYENGEPQHAVAILDTDNGARTVAKARCDPALVDAIHGDRFNGTSVHVSDGWFSFALSR
jgi:acetyl-CoA C-acetyltransferase